MKKWHYPFLAFLIIGTVLILLENRPTYRKVNGLVFGTVYNITYRYNEDLKPQIEETLLKVDSSLSMFNSASVISAVNRGESVRPDTMFMNVFRLARRISALTDGAFDITVAPAVNAWGFGFKSAGNVSESTIDSLRSITGWEKVWENADGTIGKSDPRVMLDCSAIAKGYACDVVASMLRSKGIEDYMVEIGGEITMAGSNPKGNDWSIGINRPVEDTLNVSTGLQTIVSLTDCGVATSGNYRNFYYKDGKKYAHTIDPATCMPVSHSLLSATVIAADCATADALATSFMVMGAEKACALLDSLDGVRAYLILSSDDGLEAIDRL